MTALSVPDPGPKPKRKGYTIGQRPGSQGANDFDGFFDADDVASPASASPEAAAIPISGKKHLAVPVSAITERSRLQTRRPFDPEHDAEDEALVESLRARGQDDPVILEQIAGQVPAQYRLKDGHRRVYAMIYLGFKRVEAIILQEGTPASDLITLTGNVRKNFSPMEWARAIERLLQDGMTASEIARQAGLTCQRVSEWNQLLNLAPEVQSELDQQRLNLRVALALGKAPLSFQPELARVAAENDLTEKKAILLVERVRGRVVAEGASAVNVPQLAAALGLLPPVAAVNPAPDRPGPVLPHSDVGPGAPDNPQPQPDRVVAPAEAGRRKNGPGRVPEKAMTGEAVLNALRVYFPSLDLRSARSLAGQAVKCGASELALLLAGLFMLEGEQEAGEAVKSALSFPLSSDVRALLSTLETVARQYDLIERGQFDARAERLLQLQLWVARQPGRVKQAAAQARKKPAA